MKQERELKRLTLDELYDIFETEQYDEFRADFGEDLIVHGDFTVRAFMESIRNIDSTPLVYQHIMTERLLAMESMEDIGRDLGICNYLNASYIVYLWAHPLAWIENPEEENLVLKGKVSREMYDHSRYSKVTDFAFELYKEGVMQTVDELPIYVIDNVRGGLIKNIHHWADLTSNTLDVLYSISGGHIAKEDIWNNIRPFQHKALRFSIMKIEEWYDGETAAYILRLLQTEWPTIKTWKAQDLDRLSEEEILQFEYCLFHGFDMELAEWECQQESSSSHVHSTPNRMLRLFIKPELSQPIIDLICEFLIGKDKEHPRDIMMPIRAAMDAGVIHRPTFDQLKQLFPDFCPKNKSSVSYYTKSDYEPYEGQAYKNMVEEFKKLIQ